MGVGSSPLGNAMVDCRACSYNSVKHSNAAHAIKPPLSTAHETLSVRWLQRFLGFFCLSLPDQREREEGVLNAPSRIKLSDIRLTSHHD